MGEQHIDVSAQGDKYRQYASANQPKIVRLPKIEIRTTGPARAEIWIDGHKLRGVRDLAVYMPLHGVPYVTIEMISTDIALDGELAVEIEAKDPLAEDAYIREIAERVLRQIAGRAGVYKQEIAEQVAAQLDIALRRP